MIYISETQEQADKHVTAVATLLEKYGADRALNKYGTPRGWRRDRVSTANGFTLDALGLDTAARGTKIDENRPGLMVFDDIDGKHDSPAATKKKSETITHSILPAGADNCAVLFVQNIIHKDSLAARLADGRADWLFDRIVSGPFKAIDNMVTTQQYDEELKRLRSIIVSGDATWEGQTVQDCQNQIDTFGLRAFMEESQHEVSEREGALWTRELLEQTRVFEAPIFRRIVVAVDPSGGGNDIGIIVAGIDFNGHAHIIEDCTQSGKQGVNNWAQAVASAYRRHQADRVIAERNFGGDMVEATLKVSDPNLPITMVWSSRGKQVRAEPVANRFEEGRAHILGNIPSLESELVSWEPGSKWSPNRLDAAVFAITELCGLNHLSTDDYLAEWSEMYNQPLSMPLDQRPTPMLPSPDEV